MRLSPGNEAVPDGVKDDSTKSATLAAAAAVHRDRTRMGLVLVAAAILAVAGALYFRPATRAEKPILQERSERYPLHTYKDDKTGEEAPGVSRDDMKDIIADAGASGSSKTVVIYDADVTLNVSFSVNNTEEEIEKFTDCIKKADCNPSIHFAQPLAVQVADSVFNGTNSTSNVTMATNYSGFDCSRDSCVLVPSRPSDRRGLQVGATTGTLTGTKSVVIGCSVACLAVVGVTIVVVEIVKKGCFPSDALVVAAEGIKAISSVKVGDLLLTSAGLAPVYLLGHADHYSTASFVQVLTNTSDVLELTMMHFIVANGIHTLAKDLKIGDTIQVGINGGNGFVNASISGLGVVRKQGLFNPYTTTGDLVVFSPESKTDSGGVLVSAHSDWFAEEWVDPAKIPSLYQALLAPVRAIHAVHPQWNERFAAYFDKETGPLDQQGFCRIVGAMAATF